jgi:uncharacterized protein YjbI with pentapeptide repeats
LGRLRSLANERSVEEDSESARGRHHRLLWLNSASNGSLARAAAVVVPDATFLADAFFAGAFFAGALLADIHLAGAFLAGAFFAGAFFAGVLCLDITEAA